jgi:single-stranded-DNA-specific exonuclease
LPEPSLLISTWLDYADLGERLLEELDRLHPFGQGNSEPVFGLQGIVLDEAPQTFGEGNFRFRMPASPGARRGIAGIAWRLGTAPAAGEKVDMAIRFSWNYWRDSRNPQATLVDWKPSE